MECTISEQQSGKHLRDILKQELSLSQRVIQKLKTHHRIYVNGKQVRTNTIVNAGDQLFLDMDFDEVHPGIVPEAHDLHILFEDDMLLVLSKPANTVVHPTSLHMSGTLSNHVMHYFQTQNIKAKIRPVNRLDRDTTGVILFAKKQFIQDALTKQMRSGTFVKEYLGVVCGKIPMSSGTIDFNIARAKGSIMLREVSENGDTAVTHYEVLETTGNVAMMKFILETGRTHQIRVHCLAAGFPLVGDGLYGRKKAYAIGRQALHSWKSTIVHPITKETLTFTAPIQEDITNAYRVLCDEG